MCGDSGNLLYLNLILPSDDNTLWGVDTTRRVDNEQFMKSWIKCVNKGYFSFARIGSCGDRPSALP